MSFRMAMSFSSGLMYKQNLKKKSLIREFKNATFRGCIFLLYRVELIQKWRKVVKSG